MNILSEDLFRRGNFVGAYRSATSLRLRGISAICLGLYQEGLSLLADVGHCEETDCYRALAYWCLRDNGAALSVLKKCHSSRAEALRTMLQRRPRILFQARHDFTPSWSLGEIAEADPDLEVRTIGSWYSDSIQVDADTDAADILHQLGDWSPDVYFVQRMQSKLIPVGLDKLNCPVIFQVEDHSDDYNVVVSKLPPADMLIVIGGQAHSELLPIAQKPTLTYPKVFCIEPRLVDQFRGEKKVDVFFSGQRVVHDGLFDKFNALTEIQFTLGPRVTVSGQVSQSEYYQLLSNARVVPSYIHRSQDGFSSRGLEGIACGAVTVVPRDNALTLYFSVNEGAIDTDPSDYVRSILLALDHWEGFYSKAAERGRRKALAEFTRERVVNQLLKWVAFQSIGVVRSAYRASNYRHYYRVDSAAVQFDSIEHQRFLKKLAERNEEFAISASDANAFSASALLYWEWDKAHALELMRRAHGVEPANAGVLLTLAQMALTLGDEKSADKFAMLTTLANASRVRPGFCWIPILPFFVERHCIDAFFDEWSLGNTRGLRYLKGVALIIRALVAETKSRLEEAHGFAVAAAEIDHASIPVVSWTGCFLARHVASHPDWRNQALGYLWESCEAFRANYTREPGRALRTLVENCPADRERLERRVALAELGTDQRGDTIERDVPRSAHEHLRASANEIERIVASSELEAKYPAQLMLLALPDSWHALHPVVFPQWIHCFFPKPVMVAGLALRHQVGLPERAPANLKLLGRNGEGAWREILSETNARYGHDEVWCGAANLQGVHFTECRLDIFGNVGNDPLLTLANIYVLHTLPDSLSSAEQGIQPMPSGPSRPYGPA